MGLMTAIKVFFKALSDEKGALNYLDHQQLSLSAAQDDDSHLRLLALLQHSGRFIDFLKEDISQFKDQQVGAVARQVHEECRKIVEDVVGIRPILEEEEGSQTQVERHYDPSMIRLCGHVQDNFPLKGTVRHCGWKASKTSLPKSIGKGSHSVLAAAQVEIK